MNAEWLSDTHTHRKQAPFSPLGASPACHTTILRRTHTLVYNCRYGFTWRCIFRKAQITFSNPIKWNIYTFSVIKRYGFLPEMNQSVESDEKQSKKKIAKNGRKQWKKIGTRYCSCALATRFVYVTWRALYEALFE